MSTGRDGGQASVELALVLPVVALLLLAVLQVVVVGRTEVLTVHAAREGARMAAVGADEAAVRAAVLGRSGLEGGRAEVEVQRGVDLVTVVVRYRQPTDLPLVGPLIGDVQHVARTTMRREDLPGPGA